MTIWWLAYLALGAFVGFFAGLLGIGGGSLMVPVLVMMFTAQAFPAGEVMHLALGTSMATIFFTSISSVRTHHAHGAVLWPVVARITPGIILGTLIGTHVASLVPTRMLALIFTLFICYVSVQMIINLKPQAHRDLPGIFGTGLVGAGIGGELLQGEGAEHGGLAFDDAGHLLGERHLESVIADDPLHVVSAFAREPGREAVHDERRTTRRAGRRDDRCPGTVGEDSRGENLVGVARGRQVDRAQFAAGNQHDGTGVGA